MYMFINALILALMMPAGAHEKVEDGPACRAQLTGLDLLTTVEFPSGLTVEGPWRVVHNGEINGNEAQYVMYATLDRVIETDDVTGRRNVVPFPQPISLAFEGPTQKELVQHAAHVWCLTVMRAQDNQQLQRLAPRRAIQTRVAAVLAARSWS
ncbi:MAG TPA: hypothetical protein VK929_15215 [Longimicrobiales bacterium]|nr:hypothetical protein [Longimicrobiales bacterium]